MRRKFGRDENLCYVTGKPSTRYVGFDVLATTFLFGCVTLNKALRPFETVAVTEQSTNSRNIVVVVVVVVVVKGPGLRFGELGNRCSSPSRGSAAR